MFIGESNNLLSSRGFSSLKYFTILSNLFEAFACLIWLYKKDERIKYIAAVSVALTLVVVLVFLGPIFGYPFMFMGSNLWFHLIVPVISILEVIIFNRNTISRKDNLLALLPMVIYGIGYVGNILINGIGNRPYTNDWYGFFMWGYQGAVAIILIIILGTYFIGFIIRRINNKLKNRIGNK